ncbi:MAG: phosphoglycerate kinase [Nitrospirae bacterium]|nr:MAG: phosphoglycerate kinase [Nitrospirota bacterium]
MKQSLSDLPRQVFMGKRVLVRVDFNVPIVDGRVREDYRLRRAVPTIEFLSSQGARVILISHLGRPKGKVVPAFSLRPVAERLSSILRVPAVHFVDDVIGEKARQAVEALKDGEVLLLENLRFHPGEEANDPQFAQALASFGEIFVNDAFGTMHRAHASTVGVTPHFSIRVMGFLVKKEVEVLAKIRESPVLPFTIVVGGMKIQDKLAALKALFPKASRILLGGGLAYTFLAAKGVDVGDSPVEQEAVPWAKHMLDLYQEKIALPVDHVIAVSLEQRQGFQIVHGSIPEGFRGVDIGRQTSLAYTHELMRGEGTIFWNGPLGAFEIDEFADGTVDVARAMALAYWRGAMTVVGGGDTIAALRKAEVMETEVSHVSTGGGASLRYIGGEPLPGLETLSDVEVGA